MCLFEYYPQTVLDTLCLCVIVSCPLIVFSNPRNPCYVGEEGRDTTAEVYTRRLPGTYCLVSHSSADRQATGVAWPDVWNTMTVCASRQRPLFFIMFNLLACRPVNAYLVLVQSLHCHQRNLTAGCM